MTSPQQALLLPLYQPDSSKVSSRDALIIEHLWTVSTIARGIICRLPRHVSRDDVYSAGLMGLFEAACSFDKDRSVSFSTYAYSRIRGAIIDTLRAAAPISRKLHIKARALEASATNLSTRLQRPPDDTELAADLAISLSQYYRLRCQLRDCCVVRHLSDLNSLEDDVLAQIPERYAETPLDHYLTQEMSDLLTHAMSALDERERLVVALRYDEGATFKGIAAVLGVSERRGCQLHASAIKKLRTLLTGYLHQTVPIRDAHLRNGFRNAPSGSICHVQRHARSANDLQQGEEKPCNNHQS